MKIVIFGAQGNLGQELFYALESLHEVIPLSRFNVDLRDFAQVNALIKNLSPDLIINAASINEVQKKCSKKEEELVFQVNAVAVENLAFMAREIGALFVQISCSLVLSASKNKSIIAKRQARDLIGKSKILAEEQIEKVFKKEKKYLILRTGLLFGDYGFSVVNKFKRILKSAKKVRVIEDVCISLTSTKLLADYLVDLLKPIKSKKNFVFLNQIEQACFSDKFSYVDLIEILIRKMGVNLEIKKIKANSENLLAGDFSLKNTVEIFDENKLDDFL